MKKLDPCLFAQIGSLIATELTRGKTIEEMNVIKNIATQVSSTIQVIISEQALSDKCSNSQKPPN